jgi:hypothetical protein
MLRLVFPGICAHSSRRERTNCLMLAYAAMLLGQHTSGLESKASTSTFPVPSALRPASERASTITLLSDKRMVVSEHVNRNRSHCEEEVSRICWEKSGGDHVYQYDMLQPLRQKPFVSNRHLVIRNMHTSCMCDTSPSCDGGQSSTRHGP